MKCPNCGTSSSGTLDSCPFCGAPLLESDEVILSRRIIPKQRLLRRGVSRRAKIIASVPLVIGALLLVAGLVMTLGSTAESGSSIQNEAPAHGSLKNVTLPSEPKAPSGMDFSGSAGIATLMNSGSNAARAPSNDSNRIAELPSDAAIFTEATAPSQSNNLPSSQGSTPIASGAGTIRGASADQPPQPPTDQSANGTNSSTPTEPVPSLNASMPDNATSGSWSLNVILRAGAD